MKTPLISAKTVFYDEDALVIPDPDHSMDEERFVINMYLLDCAKAGRKLSVAWKK